MDGGSSGGGLLSGLGAKASSAGTFLNAGLQQGFMTGSTTFAGAGKLGFMNSTAGAAAGAAGIAAGGAMAVHGGMNVYNDFKSGDVSGKTALSGLETAGGAIGAGALIALGASNPIGWVALAVGGLAMAGRAAWDYADYCKESTDATKELQEETDRQVKQMKEQHREEMKSYNEFNQKIQQTNDYETAKSLILQSGIATEEELQGEQYKSLGALKELTQQYINSKNEMNQNSETFLRNLKNETNKDQQGFISDFLKKYGEDMDYKNLGDKDKAAINEYGQQMQDYISELVASGDIDKEENKHAKYMWEKGILDRDYTDYLTEDDYRALFRDGTNADRRVVGKKMLAQDKYYNSLMANGDNAKDVLGWKYNYNTINGNEEEIAKQLAGLVGASERKDKESVESYVSSLKLAGLNSLDQLAGDDKTKIENALKNVGIESYRVGSDFIAYDQIAQLHQGEAVLTADTTTDLKATLGTENVSTWSSDSLSENISRGFDSVAGVIVDQTKTLVSKMNEIIQVITNLPSSNNSNLATASRFATTRSLDDYALVR